MFLILFVTVTACGGSGGERMSGPDGGPDGCDAPSYIPDEYACQVNPLTDDSAAITAGETIWFDRCVVCHGREGRGDGEEAMMYDPLPSNLLETMAQNQDDYLLWRISEGGVNGDPIESAMPSWTEEGYTRTQIWQVIAFLRTLE